jgi:hypothetical protein
VQPVQQLGTAQLRIEPLQLDPLDERLPLRPIRLGVDVRSPSARQTSARALSGPRLLKVSGSTSDGSAKMSSGESLIIGAPRRTPLRRALALS